MLHRLGPVLLASLAGVGGFKAIPAVAGLPVDVTVLVSGLAAALFIWVVVVSDRFTVPSVIGKPVMLLAAFAPPVLWSSWSPYSATKIGLFFTVTAVCLVAPVVLIQDRHQLRVFLAAVAGIGLLMAVASLSGFTDMTATRVTAFDASPLHLASFGGALFVLAVVWTTARKIRLPLGLGVSVLSLVVVIGTGTRAAAIGALAALLVVVVAARGQGWRRFAKVVLLFPALATTVAYGLRVAPVPARYRLEAAIFDILGDQSTITRAEAWWQSIEIMGTYPLGVGIGDWPDHAEGHLTYPHNMLLEAGAEAGWFALGAILLFLALAARAAWQYSTTPEGQMLLGLLTFLVLQAMSRGDLNSHRLLFVVATVCLTLPRLLERNLGNGREGPAVAYPAALPPVEAKPLRMH